MGISFTVLSSGSTSKQCNGGTKRGDNTYD